jgi:hypothetical protein
MSDLVPFQEHFAGSFAVVKSPLIRGVWTAIQWLVPGHTGSVMNRVFFFSTKEDARREARQRLETPVQRIG